MNENNVIHPHVCTLIYTVVFFGENMETSVVASVKLELQKQMKTDKQGSGLRHLASMQAGENESVHALIRELFSLHTCTCVHVQMQMCR